MDNVMDLFISQIFKHVFLYLFHAIKYCKYICLDSRFQDARISPDNTLSHAGLQQ